MASKKRGLSKGLDALLADTLDLTTVVNSSKATVPAVQITAGFVEINVKQLHPGRYQPRRTINETELETLANSIREQGILQPIVVRNSDMGYEIIAGERRWRAAQLAGLSSVPVIIKDVNDEAALAIGLIENIQRENLNALEEALALARLDNEFGLSHAEIADAVGKSRSAVTNLLRLLNLPTEVQTLLDRGDIELGHAKVLLGVPAAQQLALARVIVAKKLSVRETEHLVERTLAQADGAAKIKKMAHDPDIRRLEKKLTESIGCPVQILQSAKGKGKLQIKYNSLDELDGILAHIMQAQE